MNAVFVYAKNGKIKVLNMTEANAYNDKLLSDGWVHTNTIDPCVWMENLHNNLEDVDIVSEVRELVFSNKF